MNVRTLKARLLAHPGKKVRFILPDGSPIPAEFHVTEVGHVVKNFIDCGGTKRSLESCLLQTWVSDDDKAHRLTAGKLAKILDLSKKVIPNDGVGVEVEYGCCAVAQYTLDSAKVRAGVLAFTLGNKKTDCLARESCGLEPESSGCSTGAGNCCQSP